MSGLNPDGLGVNRTYGNVESDSVNTDDLTVEQVGNILRAETGYIPIIPMYMSSGGFFTLTSGSGNISVNDTSGIDTRTGTTADSVARITADFQDNPITKFRLEWGQDTEYRLQHGFGTYDEVGYAVLGLVTESDQTTEHIGFLAEGGELKGTVGDGSSQTKVTLQTAPDANNDLRFVHDASDGSVTWYVNNTEQGSTTTNIPVGSSEAKKWTWLATNPNGANLINRTGFGEVLYH